MAIDRDLLAAIGPRVRLSPFFDRTVAAGLQSVSCYNHMWLPMSYGDPDAEYDRLTTGVSMWDVAAQRHVEVAGRDADAVVQRMTVIDTSAIAVGSAEHAPMVDHDGRLVNDPVLLHIADREWRFSIADSDIRLWVDATARAHHLECTVRELPTATLAVQGPKAGDVMTALGLGSLNDLARFRMRSIRIDEVPLRVCRSGWSTQGGFEFFLDDPTGANIVWDRVADAGSGVGIGPGAPNPSERIENVLLSYGTDTGYDADPFELGLGETVDFNCGDFVGRSALERRVAQDPSRRLRGLLLDGRRNQPLARPLDLEVNGRGVGQLRAAAWSPRFGRTLGLGLITASVGAGSPVEVIDHGALDHDEVVEHGEVVELPFDDNTWSESNDR